MYKEYPSGITDGHSANNEEYPSGITNGHSANNEEYPSGITNGHSANNEEVRGEGSGKLRILYQLRI